MPETITEILAEARALSQSSKVKPQVFQRLGQRSLGAGEPLVAYDILAAGLERSPNDVGLQQLLALALARSGAPEKANALLCDLLGAGVNQRRIVAFARTHLEAQKKAGEETVGILARTYKDLWVLAKQPAEQKRYLSLAHELYLLAYENTRGYWSGINAATTALFLKKKQNAQRLAREVYQLCLKEIQSGTKDRYWIRATLGEAALILGNWKEASDWYARAGRRVQGRYADLSTTRRQARLILEHLGEDRLRLDPAFRIPRVVVFAGHMIDKPGRPKPRFPSQVENSVRDAISDYLEDLDAGFGYASAACGSDILFLEAMLERGGEVHIVLPCGRDEFRKTSVEIVPGADWGQRFTKVLNAATHVTEAGDHASSTIAYEYANLMLDGLALLRKQTLDTDFTALTVWDGRPGDGPGGTASRVEEWRKQGRAPTIIDIQPLAKGVSSPSTKGCEASRDGPRAPVKEAEFPKQIVAMLFADVVGYSKLTEEHIPRFIRHFMGAAARLMDSSRYSIAYKNTWGDALYLVFPRIEHAGRLALRLCEMVNNTRWEEKGLPKHLNLRIALHAGPVYLARDPVVKKRQYTGSHVNQAARIEPITPPGHVYASQSFATIAAAKGVSDFAMEYVGQTPLAKGYGTFPIYHVRRRNE